MSDDRQSLGRLGLPAASPDEICESYELGGFLIFGGVVLAPCIIVLGIVFVYMAFF